MKKRYNYGTALLAGFEYLLKNHPEVFVIGQGVWSPWYVGNSMTDLDKKFGRDRVIDTPVSEAAITGAAVGASLAGMRPVVVHPRMDFLLYAIDPIVNEAAKWSHMIGGQANPQVTIRAIINRGGEQGAQHSQLLHAWFTHIPGLRVVMPSTVADARNLLISSVLCNDPVMFVDDRWLYELEDELPEVEHIPLELQKSKISRSGEDITIVGAGYSAQLSLEAAELLKKDNLSAEVVDVRVLNPFNPSVIVESVKKTGRLLVVDGGWKTSGFAGEVIASVVENIPTGVLKDTPIRITLPSAPAPCAPNLEKLYYPTVDIVVDAVKNIVT